MITDGFTENLTAKGVPAKKIRCIPNWVEVKFIRPLPKVDNAFRRAHDLEDKFVVMYSGNIALTQGLKTVIRAAAHLSHVPEIVFVIVGEPQALTVLKETCIEYQLENVRLLPFQPREQLPEMLAAADVGLVMQKNNVISFNMPSKIQVLLASGRPIIASVPSTGTAARAILQSGGGMIVEPEQPDKLAEAILHLQQNPAEAEALGLQGRRYAVLNYSFEQALSRYEELFYQITAARRTALPELTTEDVLMEDVLMETVPIELEKTQV